MKVVFTPEAERDIERLAYIQVVSDYLKSEYDKASFDYGGDVWCIKSNGKWGLANYYGEELLSPCYDWMADSFVEGMLVVGIYGNGIGYINLQGEEVVKPMYEEATDFHNGFAAVRLNGK
ncbi:MAG: WG repeat-containing protein [Alistipes sp.]|nr:WG repeat-containing protein [Alistipes sp.]MBR3892226.1 WG repeat-containing protein [Alistipes sp.]